MRILVVTSEVTFVPRNYNGFLENLLEGTNGDPEQIIEVAIFKNNSPLLIIKGLLLALMGARKTGFTLMKNSLNAYLKDRSYLEKKYEKKFHSFTGPNTSDFQQFMRDHEIDLLINARTRFIYKSKTLKIPKLASLNIHHGLLPEYRGTMCDLWALFDNRPTGFSIHIMEKKIDNGEIIRQVKTSVEGDDIRKSFTQLIYESSKIEGRVAAELIKNIRNLGKIPIGQSNSKTHSVYTKNPDFLAIRKMLQKGIAL